MRIVIATGIFPPDIGGPATYSKVLAEELVKRGHTVTVVTYGSNESRSKNQESRNNNYELRVTSYELRKGIRHMVYFWRVYRAGRNADVIYAQDAVSAGFPAAVAALLLKRRFILKIVGDHAWEQGVQRFGVRDLLDDFLGKSYGARVGMLRMVQRFAGRRAKHIIVPSEYLKSVVERWGLKPDKITVIPNAVSISQNLVSKKEARAKLGLDSEAFILLSIGRLVPWKGFGMLIELMPRITAKISDAKLIIIGNGPDEDILRVTSYELRVPVIFTGGIPKENIALYLAAADMFCLNTAYEGFSHQLIEAMTAGIPVITTNAGGNKEIIRDGENALVARYNDDADWQEKIFLLYHNEALRLRLSRGGEHIADHYSLERMVIKTESIIRNS